MPSNESQDTKNRVIVVPNIGEFVFPADAPDEDIQSALQTSIIPNHGFSSNDNFVSLLKRSVADYKDEHPQDVRSDLEDLVNKYRRSQQLEKEGKPDEEFRKSLDARRVAIVNSIAERPEYKDVWTPEEVSTKVNDAIANLLAEPLIKEDTKRKSGVGKGLHEAAIGWQMIKEKIASNPTADPLTKFTAGLGANLVSGFMSGFDEFAHAVENVVEPFTDRAARSLYRATTDPNLPESEIEKGSIFGKEPVANALNLGLSTAHLAFLSMPPVMAMTATGDVGVSGIKNVIQTVSPTTTDEGATKAADVIYSVMTAIPFGKIPKSGTVMQRVGKYLAQPMTFGAVLSNTVNLTSEGVIDAVNIEDSKEARVFKNLLTDLAFIGGAEGYERGIRSRDIAKAVKKEAKFWEDVTNYSAEFVNTNPEAFMRLFRNVARIADNNPKFKRAFRIMYDELGKSPAMGNTVYAKLRTDLAERLNISKHPFTMKEEAPTTGLPSPDANVLKTVPGLDEAITPKQSSALGEDWVNLKSQIKPTRQMIQDFFDKNAVAIEDYKNQTGVDLKAKLESITGDTYYDAIRYDVDQFVKWGENVKIPPKQDITEGRTTGTEGAEPIKIIGQASVTDGTTIVQPGSYTPTGEIVTPSGQPARPEYNKAKELEARLAGFSALEQRILEAERGKGEPVDIKIVEDYRGEILKEVRNQVVEQKKVEQPDVDIMSGVESSELMSELNARVDARVNEVSRRMYKKPFKELGGRELVDVGRAIIKGESVPEYPAPAPAVLSPTDIAETVPIAQEYISTIPRSLTRRWAKQYSQFLAGEGEAPKDPGAVPSGELAKIKSDLKGIWEGITPTKLLGAGLAIGANIAAANADDDNRDNLILLSALGVGAFSPSFIKRFNPRMMKAVEDVDNILARTKRELNPTAIKGLLNNELRKIKASGEKTVNEKEFLDDVSIKLTQIHNNRVNPPALPAQDFLSKVPEQMDIAETMVGQYEHPSNVSRAKPEMEYIQNLRVEGRYSETAQDVIRELHENYLPPGAVDVRRGEGGQTLEDVFRKAKSVYGQTVAKAMLGKFKPDEPIDPYQVVAIQMGLENYILRTIEAGRTPNLNDWKYIGNMILALDGAAYMSGLGQRVLTRDVDPRLKQFNERLNQGILDERLKLKLQRYLIGKEIPPPDFIDKLVSWARNMKLWSTSAIVRSFGGNLTMQFLDTFDKAPTALASKALEAITGKTQDRFAVESYYRWKGVNIGMKGVGDHVFNVLKGKEFDTIYEREQIYRLQTIPGKVGKVVELGQRAQGAIDVAFRLPSEEGALYTHMAREGMKNGLRGIELERFVDSKVKEFHDIASQSIVGRPKWVTDLMTAIPKEAQRLTFQSELGSIGGAVNRIRGEFRLSQLVVPFFNTWANIWKTMVEYSPLSVFTPSFSKAFIKAFAKNGNKFFDIIKKQREKVGKTVSAEDISTAHLAERVGRMVTGSVLLASMTNLFYDVLGGYITGGGANDKEKAKLQKEYGFKPYSIGVGDAAISYRGFEPLSSWFAMVADGVHGYEDGGYLGSAFKITENVGKNFAENPFLLGITDIADAMSGSKSPYKILGAFAVASTVPNFMPQIARVFDPVEREKNVYFFDDYKRAVPFLSKELLPQRGILGEPIEIQNPAGRLFAVDVSFKPESKLLREIGRLSQSLNKTYGVPGDMVEGVELTPQQHNELIRIAGEYFEEAGAKLVNAPAYDQLSNGEKDFLFTSILNSIKPMVQKTYFFQEAIQGKRQKLEPFFEGGRYTPEESERIKQQLRNVLPDAPRQ